MRSYLLIEAAGNLADGAKIGVLDKLGAPVELRIIELPKGAAFSHAVAPANQAAAEPRDVLTLDVFARYACESADYPGFGAGTPGAIMVPVGGLAGEAGAMLHDWMRIVRRELPCTEESRAVLATYLSKLLWYAAALAAELKVPLSRLAEQSIRDARARKQARATEEQQEALLPEQNRTWWNGDGNG